MMTQKDRKEYLTWLKKKKAPFKKVVHDPRPGRRREKQNLEQRTYEEALIVFGDLLDNNPFLYNNSKKEIEDDREELEILNSILLREWCSCYQQSA